MSFGTLMLVLDTLGVDDLPGHRTVEQLAKQIKRHLGLFNLWSTKASAQEVVIRHPIRGEAKIWIGQGELEIVNPQLFKNLGIEASFNSSEEEVKILTLEFGDRKFTITASAGTWSCEPDLAICDPESVGDWVYLQSATFLWITQVAKGEQQ